MENKINKNLHHALVRYSSFAGGMLYLNIPAQAQINYMDIDPDTVICNSQAYFDIDFDQDLQTDVSLNVQDDFVYGTQYSQYYTILSHKNIISPYNNSEILMYSQAYAQFLDLNSSINGAQNFSSISGYLYFQLGNYYKLSVPGLSYTNTEIKGVWPGKTDKYLGVKFFVGSNAHYAWVRMDVTPDCDTIIIKDYAWNSVPAQGILAGQMPVGIEESNSAGNLFYHNQQIIFQPASNGNFQLNIFSADGKLVYHQNETDIQPIAVDFLSHGFYLVEVSGETKKSVIKIIKG